MELSFPPNQGQVKRCPPGTPTQAMASHFPLLAPSSNPWPVLEA